ncbi:hypothetical protein CHLRE_03g159550v5 [Chlamydomonas reinhardtii]|uniref:Uncharacterized protein n=1 Tax=Chlamydomonas reinhardtii TaxID=3055 RepID=A0A2K3DWA7_CHLRE|nr:uncharacterized protein CHLRE_03g159550v5 [Chlamydomonas reinhardtii]PNW84815.1 hypothetical protein CHLRE_03g159550v5 [Chlamydomonas reinhardtii]
MDVSVGLRPALLSLNDANLASQGVYAAKLFIDKLLGAQQAGSCVKELLSGLDKCTRAAANSRIVLLSYMLATQSSLNPVRALPQAIPSLVAYLQNQRHSTNLDELQTLGCRIGQVLAAALDGASAGGGQDWAVSDTRPQLDARGGGSYAAAYAASKGPVAADASPCHVDPAWALNHVLLPLLRVACRSPERESMAAAGAVLVPLVQSLGRALQPGRPVMAGTGSVSASQASSWLSSPVVAVLERLMGWAFTLMGSAATAPQRSSAVLQMLVSCVQALGEELGADGAKRLALAATAGLDNAEDWLVRREAANLVTALAELGASGRGGGAEWMAGPNRREFLTQSLEALRHDKIPQVRSAVQAALSAVAQLPGAELTISARGSLAAAPATAAPSMAGPGPERGAGPRPRSGSPPQGQAQPARLAEPNSRHSSGTDLMPPQHPARDQPQAPAAQQRQQQQHDQPLMQHASRPVSRQASIHGKDAGRGGAEGVQRLQQAGRRTSVASASEAWQRSAPTNNDHSRQNPVPSESLRSMGSRQRSSDGSAAAAPWPLLPRRQDRQGDSTGAGDTADVAVASIGGWMPMADGGPIAVASSSGMGGGEGAWAIAVAQPHAGDADYRERHVEEAEGAEEGLEEAEGDNSEPLDSTQQGAAGFGSEGGELALEEEGLVRGPTAAYGAAPSRQLQQPYEEEAEGEEDQQPRMYAGSPQQQGPGSPEGAAEAQHLSDFTGAVATSGTAVAWAIPFSSQGGHASRPASTAGRHGGGASDGSASFRRSSLSDAGGPQDARLQSYGHDRPAAAAPPPATSGMPRPYGAHLPAPRPPAVDGSWSGAPQPPAGTTQEADHDWYMSRAGGSYAAGYGAGGGYARAYGGGQYDSLPDDYAADLPTLLPSKSPRFPLDAGRERAVAPPPRQRLPPGLSYAAMDDAGADPGPGARSARPCSQPRQQALPLVQPPWRCPSRGPSPPLRSRSPGGFYEGADGSGSGGGGGGGGGGAAAAAGAERQVQRPDPSRMPPAGVKSSAAVRSDAARAAQSGEGALHAGLAATAAVKPPRMSFNGGGGGWGGSGPPTSASARQGWTAVGRAGAAAATAEMRAVAGVASSAGDGNRRRNAPAADCCGPVSASSPPRRYQRRDDTRVSLGWPFGYRPPKASSRFVRPSAPAEHFGVQVFAKEPPPPSPPPPSPPPPPPPPESDPDVQPGSPSHQYVVNVHTESSPGHRTAMVITASPSPGKRRADVNNAARHPPITAATPTPRTPRGMVEAAAAAAMAAMAAATTAAGDGSQAGAVHSSVVEGGGEGQQPVRVTARVRLVGAPGVGDAGQLSSPTWSSSGGLGGDGHSTYGGDDGGGGGRSAAAAAAGALQDQLQSVVEQARALQASLAQRPGKRPRRRWNTQPHQQGQHPVSPTPAFPSMTAATDPLSAAAAAQQLQMLVQQAASAQAGLQAYLMTAAPALLGSGPAAGTAAGELLAAAAAMAAGGTSAGAVGGGGGGGAGLVLPQGLAGGATAGPLALQGAVNRLEELVLALQRQAAGGGTLPSSSASPHPSQPPTRPGSMSAIPGGADAMPGRPAAAGQLSLTGEDSGPAGAGGSTAGILGPEATGALRELIQQVEATRESISRTTSGLDARALRHSDSRASVGRDGGGIHPGMRHTNSSIGLGSSMSYSLAQINNQWSVPPIPARRGAQTSGGGAGPAAAGGIGGGGTGSRGGGEAGTIGSAAVGGSASTPPVGKKTPAASEPSSSGGAPPRPAWGSEAEAGGSPGVAGAPRVRFAISGGGAAGSGGGSGGAAAAGRGSGAAGDPDSKRLGGIAGGSWRQRAQGSSRARQGRRGTDDEHYDRADENDTDGMYEEYDEYGRLVHSGGGRGYASGGGDGDRRCGRGTRRDSGRSGTTGALQDLVNRTGSLLLPGEPPFQWRGGGSGGSGSGLARRRSPQDRDGGTSAHSDAAETAWAEAGYDSTGRPIHVHLHHHNQQQVLRREQHLQQYTQGYAQTAPPGAGPPARLGAGHQSQSYWPLPLQQQLLSARQRESPERYPALAWAPAAPVAGSGRSLGRAPAGIAHLPPYRAAAGVAGLLSLPLAPQLEQPVQARTELGMPRVIDFRPVVPIASARPSVLQQGAVSPPSTSASPLLPGSTAAPLPTGAALGLAGAVGLHPSLHPAAAQPRHPSPTLQASVSRLQSLGAQLRGTVSGAAAAGGWQNESAEAAAAQQQQRVQPLAYELRSEPREPRYPAPAGPTALPATLTTGGGGGPGGFGGGLAGLAGFTPPRSYTQPTSPSVVTIFAPETSHLTINPPAPTTAATQPGGWGSLSAAAAAAAARVAAITDVADTAASTQLQPRGGLDLQRAVPAVTGALGTPAAALNPLNISLEEPLFLELYTSPAEAGGEAPDDVLGGTTDQGGSLRPPEVIGGQAHLPPSPARQATSQAHAAAAATGTSGSAADMVAMASVVDLAAQQDTATSALAATRLAAAWGPRPDDGEDEDEAHLYALPMLEDLSSPHASTSPPPAFQACAQPTTALESGPGSGRLAAGAPGDADLERLFPATAAAMAARQSTSLTQSPLQPGAHAAPAPGQYPGSPEAAGGGHSGGNAEAQVRSSWAAEAGTLDASFVATGAMPTPLPIRPATEAHPAGDAQPPPLQLSEEPVPVSRPPKGSVATAAATAGTATAQAMLGVAMPRLLRPENLQALRDSATGLARSSIEAVREVEGLVVRLTLLQQQLAEGRRSSAGNAALVPVNPRTVALEAEALEQEAAPLGSVAESAGGVHDAVEGGEGGDAEEDEVFELPIV